MLQQIDSAHLSALEAELARITAQRDALRDALATIHAGNIMRGKSDYSWGDVIQQHYKICRNALQACQD